MFGDECFTLFTAMSEATTTTDQLTPLLITAMYTLDDEGGHIYKYNVTVGNSVARLGWAAAGWGRAAARVRSVPLHWKLNLGKQTAKFRGIAGRIEKTLAFLSTQIQLMRELRRTVDRPVIIYADWFDLVHLVIMTTALYLTKQHRHLHFWLMCRAPMTRRKAAPRRLLHRLIEIRLGRHRLQLLGESELVDQYNVECYGKSVTTMPIVTTNQRSASENPDIERVKATLPSHKLRLWWPGRPFPHKGPSIIDSLMSTPSRSSAQAVILTSDRYSPPPRDASADMVEHVEVPDPLTPTEFSDWIQFSDVILLPYDVSVYRKIPSAIFVESSVANRMALVTDNTWMAYQYRKYGYPEFIIDWTQPNLIDRIVTIGRDAEHRRRSAEFAEQFSRLHNEASFAEEMAKLWKTVQASER
jgi:hypothetical protein